MRTLSKWLTSVVLLGLSTSPVDGQWTFALNPVLTAPTSGVTVGTGGASLSSLTVRGDQMSTPTGEVFRTRGPFGVDTHWRLFRDNLEVGDLFSLNSDEHFHVNGAAGDIRFWTFESAFIGSVQRARLTRSSVLTIGSYFAQPITGHLGVGSFGSAVNNP